MLHRQVAAALPPKKTLKAAPIVSRSSTSVKAGTATPKKAFRKDSVKTAVSKVVSKRVTSATPRGKVPPKAAEKKPIIEIGVKRGRKAEVVETKTRSSSAQAVKRSTTLSTKTMPATTAKTSKGQALKHSMTVRGDKKRGGRNK